MPNPESAPPGEQQYPFRDATPDEIGRVILDHEKLISACVLRRLRRKHRSHADDVEQEIRLALIAAVPRFDATLGFRLSTFLYRCIQNAFTRALERLDREVAPDQFPDEHEQAAPDPEPEPTDDVLLLAARVARIVAHPDDFGLTPKQAALLKMRAAGLDRQTIASRLGITPYSVSRSCTRLKRKLAELVQLGPHGVYHVSKGVS